MLKMSSIRINCSLLIFIVPQKYFSTKLAENIKIFLFKIFFIFLFNFELRDDNSISVKFFLHEIIQKIIISVSYSLMKIKKNDISYMNF